MEPTNRTDHSKASFSSMAATFLDAAPEYVFCANADGRYVYANQKACLEHGFRLDELITMSVFDINPDFTPDVWRDHWNRLKVEGTVTFDAKHRLRLGEEIFVEISSRYLVFDGCEYACAFLRDISKRKQFERELQESRMQLEMILNSMPAAVALTRKHDGAYMSVTNGFERMIGYTSQELLGKTSLELGLISTDDRERLLALVDDTDGSSGIEFVSRCKDGADIHVAVSAVPFCYKGVDCILSILNDVSRQHALIDDLARREGQLRTLFDTMHAGFILIDSHGAITMANQRMAEMLGLTMDELIGSPYLEYVHPDYRHVGDERMNKLISGEIEFICSERLYLRSNGTEFWGHLSERRHLDNDGCLVSLVAVIADISEIKNAEEELRKREQAFVSLAENLPDVITRYDHKHRHVFVNRQLEKISGFSSSFYLNKTTAEAVADKEFAKMVDSAIAQVFETGKPVELKYDIPFSNQIKNFESRLIPEFDSNNRIDSVLAIARDITEHTTLQHERERGQRLSSLGLLAGGIAHDFNNILTSIIGNISLASRMIDQDHKAAARLDDSLIASRRATQLTQQLLTFSRGGEPIKTVVDLAELIREAISFSLLGSNVRGDFVPLPELWKIDADTGQISQMLNNLFINARQAMEAGGTIHIFAANHHVDKSSNSVLKPGPYVSVLVRDEGGGISASDLDHIFDPYFTTKEHGTGLGLTSVYSIVQRHGGAVEAASKLGAGTTFTIYLPAVTSAVEEMVAENVETGLQGGNGRVLIMDDETMIVRMATIMLEEAGYQVASCHDGATAISMFKDGVANGSPFDAIILDLTIPGGMGGQDVAAQIRKLDNEIVLIVSSGYSCNPVLADYASYGFSGCVIKPYTLDNLTAELANLIKKRDDLELVQ